MAPSGHRCCSLSWGEARGPGGARRDEGCDQVTAEPPPQAPLFLSFPGLTTPPKPRGPGGGRGVLHAPRRPAWLA